MGVACQTWARCGMALRACTPSGARGRHAAGPRGAPGGPGTGPARPRRRQHLAAGQLLGIVGGAAGAMDGAQMRHGLNTRRLQVAAGLVARARSTCTGSGRMKSVASLAGSAVWSSGVCIPEASFAKSLLCAIPQDMRTPTCSRAAARARAPIMLPACRDARDARAHSL